MTSWRSCPGAAFHHDCKNPTNERLFAGPSPDMALNPYARIIIG